MVRRSGHYGTGSASVVGADIGRQDLCSAGVQARHSKGMLDGFRVPPLVKNTCEKCSPARPGDQSSEFSTDIVGQARLNGRQSIGLGFDSSDQIRVYKESRFRLTS